MDDGRQLYERLDGWLRDRSRTEYAIFVGTVSACCHLAVGTLFGDANVVAALGIGVVLAVLLAGFRDDDQV